MLGPCATRQASSALAVSRTCSSVHSCCEERGGIELYGAALVMGCCPIIQQGGSHLDKVDRRIAVHRYAGVQLCGGNLLETGLQQGQCFNTCSLNGYL